MEMGSAGKASAHGWRVSLYHEFQALTFGREIFPGRLRKEKRVTAVAIQEARWLLR